MSITTINAINAINAINTINTINHHSHHKFAKFLLAACNHHRLFAYKIQKVRQIDEKISLAASQKSRIFTKFVEYKR